MRFPWAGTFLSPRVPVKVDLVISSGSSGTVTVPDLTGLSEADAEAAIVAAGLTVGTVTTAPSDTVPAGDVISHDPAAGASVAPGSAVDLVVSSGPAAGEVLIAVDIRPGSCPNPLNRRARGVLPLAIAGTPGFDVASIDPTTIRLEGISPTRSSREDVATPFEPFVGRTDRLDCTEEGSDGQIDLSLKFENQAVVGAVGSVSRGDVLVLKLTGQLVDGRPIRGEDVVVVVQ